MCFFIQIKQKKKEKMWQENCIFCAVMVRCHWSYSGRRPHRQGHTLLLEDKEERFVRKRQGGRERGAGKWRKDQYFSRSRE